jgi:cytochrome c biogenesis protein CcmG/thiol:disulfide interchange protein DsbE
MLVGAALIGLLVYGVAAQSVNRTIDDLVSRGAHPAAPESTRMLPALQGGGGRSLASLRGKVVVLNFWASWCEPCQVEAPLLERFQARLEAHDATVLGVTYLDASPDSQSFVRRYHLTYPNVRDSVGTFAHSYGTNQLPETFLLDRRGRIVALSRGEISEPFLTHALAIAESS